MSTSEARPFPTETVARVILGLLFVVHGINGFLGIMPELTGSVPDRAAAFAAALVIAGLFPFINAIELAAGLLLLSNRFVPLALAVLAPIAINLLGFYVVLAQLAPTGTALAVLVCGLELYLAWTQRDVFRPMLAARPSTSIGASRPVQARTPKTESEIDASLELGEEAEVFYRDGLTSLKEGRGVGACGSFRRVVEIETERLIDLAQKAAEAEDDQDGVAKLIQLRTSFPVGERLKAAGSAAPRTLRGPGGKNYLAALYDAYNEALRDDLGEQECVVRAGRLKVLFEAVLIRLRSASKEARRLEKLTSSMPREATKQN